MEPSKQSPVEPEPAPKPQAAEATPPPAPTSAQPPAAVPGSPAPFPVVTVQPPAAPQAPAVAVNGATPAIADDVDVIEKEWVDAAENVVKSGASDPHKEEEGFETLQVSYLKKRYNKDIKEPSE